MDHPTTLPSPPPSSSPSSPPPVAALILHGNDDPFVTPEKLAECTAGLDALGVAWDVHVYSRARHAFTRPEKNTPADLVGRCSLTPDFRR